MENTCCIRLALIVAAGVLFAVGLGVGPARTAEAVKLGIIGTTSNAGAYIAKERGYFAAEGLDVSFVKFDAAQPIAVATLSGDVDLGLAGVSSALYNLAIQGSLQIVAGWSATHPGFHTAAIIASNKTYDAGTRSMADIAGKSVALTQIGSTYHYAYAVIAAKYGVDIKTLRVLPLQSMGNVASAVTGGQADIGVLSGPVALPLEHRGDFKILAWSEDEVRMQLSVAVASTRAIKTDPDRLRRILRALARGSKDYHDAFTGADGTPQIGSDAPAILALVAKNIGQSVEQLSSTAGYYDDTNRLDLVDLQRQINWFASQGMLKEPFSADLIVDRQFVLPLPPS